MSKKHLHLATACLLLEAQYVNLELDGNFWGKQVFVRISWFIKTFGRNVSVLMNFCWNTVRQGPDRTLPGFLLPRLVGCWGARIFSVRGSGAAPTCWLPQSWGPQDFLVHGREAGSPGNAEWTSRLPHSLASQGFPQFQGTPWAVLCSLGAAQGMPWGKCE